MSTSDLNKLTNRCEELMASETLKILLFSARFVKKLKNISYPFMFKMYLLPLITWFDHSILRELIKSTGNMKAVKLIDQFDSKINFEQPITEYTIPEFSQLMIPLENDRSEYSILVIKSLRNNSEMTLQDLFNIKNELILTWELTDHAIHLIAMHSKSNCFYWLIPIQLRSLIADKLTEDQQVLWNRGIIVTGILPDNYLYTENNHHAVESELNPLYFSTVDTTKVFYDIHTYVRM